ncbi:MAG: phosphoribulokinase, partial [Gammaproteobacteria bacterium]
KFCVDFPYLLNMIQGSFMSRRNSIVVPGGKMGFAMEIIFAPIIHRMIEESRNA